MAPLTHAARPRIAPTHSCTAPGKGRLKAAAGTRKQKKAAVSGKPKRPPSAFFIFMSEFKKEYQVSKAAGEKWRSMFKEESTRSKKAKTEEDEGEGSDKSKSEVNDDYEDGVSDEDAEFIERNLDVLLELMISSLPCQFPSKQYRLECLHHLIVYILKDSSKLRKREIVS